MNRIEYMRKLASLLQDVPAEERVATMQYYNDYFDDAGKENEQEVIGALGNPARAIPASSVRPDTQIPSLRRRMFRDSIAGQGGGTQRIPIREELTQGIRPETAVLTLPVRMEMLIRIRSRTEIKGRRISPGPAAA